MKRTCRRCGTVRDITEFYPYGKNNGRRHICIPCKQAEHKHAHATRNYARRWKLLGIRRSDYEFGYRSRGGRCDICRTVHPTLCVDHDHVTGTIRGLLCNNCNAGLGFFADNAEWLQRAATYLRNNP